MFDLAGVLRRCWKCWILLVHGVPDVVQPVLDFVEGECMFYLVLFCFGAVFFIVAFFRPPLL